MIDHATNGKCVAERGTNEIVVKISEIERDDEKSKSGKVALTKGKEKNKKENETDVSC